MRHVAIDGLDVAYRVVGSGPPLVLLHGGLCDSRVWRDQLGDLAADFTVTAWDAPGCGGSSDPPESFRLPEYADCLAGLLDELDVDDPHVLGHSFGGGLALELFRRHPGIPRSLVLAGAYAGWAGSLPTSEGEARLQSALSLADRLPLDVDPELVPGLFSDRMPARMVEHLRAIMSDIRPAGTRTMARAFAEADLRDVLARVSVPVLLLHGENDERAPLGIAEALHAGMPTSTLVILAGLGHESYLEASKLFNDEVRRFLGALS